MKLPLGYRYAAIYAGIRKEKKNDVGLIVSDKPASAAAVFTTNRVQAAPVLLMRRHLKASHGVARAVLVNAGNANCATRTGLAVAQKCCQAVAKALKAPVEQVLPASTGVIGVEMDPRGIVKVAPKLVRSLSKDHFLNVARAIMTTDTRPKAAFQEVPLRGGTVHITGITKGSGMIHPNMATTLGFVMTDAAIPPKLLRPMLLRAMDRSYNRISVDGDMSTNDTVILLANGASGLTPDKNELKVVEEVFCWVAEDLAEQIVQDGEGARKIVSIHVSGAPSNEDADKIARTIANSPLVKTAIAGSDPNWGRILSAAGCSGVAFDPSKVDIYLQREKVCGSGLAAEFDEHDLKDKLNERECVIRFVIRGKGPGRARFWTCDLTEQYIRINASYRT